MNRKDFQIIANTRLREARVLLKNKNYDGAYYLCGYVVECGLKACIAKNTRRYDFPDKKTINESWTHDLTKLLKIAGLEIDLDKNIKADKVFGVNWTNTKDWNEESRYEKHTEKAAQDLYTAITDRKWGIFQWIKRHW
jgi:HEPN domain-containing protein